MRRTLIYYSYPLVALVGFGLFAFFLSDAVIPLILAYFLSYLIYPMVINLQGIGINRRVAIYSTFLISFLILSLALVFVVPKMVHMCISVTYDLPNILSRVLDRLEWFSRAYQLPFHFKSQAIIHELRVFLSGVSFTSLSSLTSLLQKTFFNIVAIALWVLKILVFPIFFFYSLENFEEAKTEFKSFVPLRFRQDLKEFSEIFNTVLSGYIRGQVLVCTILALFYGFFFWVVGLKYGVVLGLLTGYMYMIPYIGFSVAFLIGIIIALSNFTTMTAFLLVVAVYIVGQVLESFFLTPRITGNRVGLDPFITILALIVGGNILGFIGILTAIPIAGILKQYYIKFKVAYQSSEFYLKEF